MGKKTNKTFEELFEELENIVEKMDLGEVDLEESLKLFETGMILVNDGKKQLEEAELKIKNLTKNSKSD
tara:strand:+ start:76 stop:282 length:207 start_codon:yes stop_codon:yes gene_type:complete